MGARCILIFPFPPSQICKHLSICARPPRVRQARRDREDDHTPIPAHPVTPRVRSHESGHRRAGWAGRQSLRRRRARVGLYTPYYVLRLPHGREEERRRTRREVEIPNTTTSCQREEFAPGFLSRTIDLYFTITRAIDFPPPTIPHSPLPTPHSPTPPPPSPPLGFIASPFVCFARAWVRYLFALCSALSLCCYVIPCCVSVLAPALTLTSLRVSGLWSLVSLIVPDSVRLCLAALVFILKKCFRRVNVVSVS